jgi:hypothetical protein
MVEPEAAFEMAAAKLAPGLNVWSQAAQETWDDPSRIEDKITLFIGKFFIVYKI